MSKRVWPNFDWLLFVPVILLVVIGLATIHSATLDSSGAKISLWDDFVFRQAVYALAGLGLYFVVAAIDYRFYRSAARLIYGLGLGLLLLLLAVGQVRGGAQSWFDLYLFPLQPSELVKLVLILALAKYFADNEEHINRFAHLVVSLLLVGVPMALVYLQPDLGTAVIMGGIWVGMAWAAGIALWQFGAIAVGGLLAAPTIWLKLDVYMQDRVLAFLNPENDPSGESYNVIQALISIGSGGVWGKGFALGTQSQLHFLRVRHTDFIFSVFAEEFGFIGSMVLFGIMLFLLWRIIRVATMARDSYGRLITVGVAMMIFVQMFINLGVNVSLLPATGLPLPFVSYGGSSLLTMMMGVGLVQSVAMRYRKLEFE